MRIGCQTYTWEMLGEAWQGRVTDLLDWIGAAGYAGIEITNNMIGEFADHPRDFLSELSRRGLKLAAFNYSSPSGFTEPDDLKSDIDGAERWMRLLGHFTGAQLGLGGAAHAEPHERRREKLDHAIAIYNEIGARAHAAGIVVNVHPHSHHGSLLETAEEYEHLLSRLDPTCMRFGPDTGHIVRGGQDLLTCLRRYLPRISHIHFKDADADGRWQPMGQGVCDFAAVLKLLAQSGYEGWIVCEEESDFARQDGIAAIRHNREYLRSLGY